MGKELTERQRVFNKSGGLCWYCGNKLVKGWHQDHYHPIERESIYAGSKTRLSGFSRRPEFDCYENKVPSCAPCNIFKSVFTIEEFRSELKLQVPRGREYSVNFRTAERFKLIQENDIKVEFWYERNGKQYPFT